MHSQKVSWDHAMKRNYWTRPVVALTTMFDHISVKPLSDMHCNSGFIPRPPGEAVCVNTNVSLAPDLTHHRQSSAKHLYFPTRSLTLPSGPFTLLLDIDPTFCSFLPTVGSLCTERSCLYSSLLACRLVSTLSLMSKQGRRYTEARVCCNHVKDLYSLR